MNRRDLLGATALLALPALATGAAVAGPEARAAASLHKRSPQELFEAYVRLRGSLDERLIYERVSGWTYATVPGEPGRLLWRLDGLGISRFRRGSDEQFVGRNRYLGALREPHGDALLEVLNNPYTGERCDVPLSVYGPSTTYLTPGGVRYQADAKPGAPLQPLQLGEWTYFTDHILSNAPPPLQPDFDIITYGARTTEAFDRRLAAVHSTSAFSATERWRDWMKMGDRAGGLFWHVVSARVTRADIPADLWALAQSVWGDQIEDL